MYIVLPVDLLLIGFTVGSLVVPNYVVNIARLNRDLTLTLSRSCDTSGLDAFVSNSAVTRSF
jgi:hypothetical protein